MVLSFFMPSDRFDKGGNPAPLPGRNEMEAAARAIRYGAAGMKQHYTSMAAAYAKAAAQKAGWETPDGKVTISFTWFEVNSRRDQDNVRAFEKYVLDGLQSAGVIHNDSQRFIEGCTQHRIVIDPECPGVSVFVQTVSDKEDSNE